MKADRIASAWLIGRFIDADAVFLFVDSKSYVHSPGEIRFDMFLGEYTHQADLCTFEVLIAEGGLRSDPALVAIAEIVHDIDLREHRYQHPETSGIARMVEGCARKQRLMNSGSNAARCYSTTSTRVPDDAYGRMAGSAFIGA